MPNRTIGKTIITIWLPVFYGIIIIIKRVVIKSEDTISIYFHLFFIYSFSMHAYYEYMYWLYEFSRILRRIICQMLVSSNMTQSFYQLRNESTIVDKKKILTFGEPWVKMLNTNSVFIISVWR